jgi:hypothetical protein
MTLPSSGLGLTLAILLTTAVWAQVKQSQEPAGDKSPLQARLIAHEDTYTLAADQQGEAFAKMLQEKMQGPPPPEVDLVFEIKNPTDKDITITLGADSGSLDLILKGPGAVTIPGQRIFTREFRTGRPVTIAAGKTHEIPIKQLKFGFRGVGMHAYWTEPGQYTLAARLTNRGGRGGMPPAMTLETEPITLTVKAAK